MNQRGGMKSVDFFIVGAPKCGTTALMKYLSRQPGVYFPDLSWGNTGKIEPDHFARDLLSPVDMYYNRDAFEKLYEHAPKTKLWGDASVYHLFSSTAAQNIFTYNSNAKIIIMLRNPAEFLFSYFKEMQFQGIEKRVDLIDALNTPIAMDPANGKAAHVLRYNELATFSAQVERYLTTFPRNQIQIIKFDDFTANTSRFFNNVLRFLDLPPDHSSSFEVVNPSKQVRSHALRSLFQHPTGRIKTIIHCLIPSKQLRTNLFVGAKQIERRINTSTNRDSIPQIQRKYILDEFRGDISKLQKLTTLDLRNWLEV